MKKDLKNRVSTIFGIIAAICGALITASQSGLILPEWAVATATGLGALSIAVIGVLTGKNPDLSAKPPMQIDKQIDEKEKTAKLGGR